jgi:HYDIN/CFA65/VesB-like, Ig-like domain
VTNTIDFDTPQPVGLVDAVAPDISSDGLTMYYESVIANEILTAVRTSIGSPWSAGVAIPISTSSNEAPSISADELTLYYMSVDVLGIDVSPSFYDFGDVEAGTSSSIIVTISNPGDLDLEIYGIGLAVGSDPGFAITLLSAVTILAPGETADVEITFAPLLTGLASGSLRILSNDLDEPVVEVGLAGLGVITELPPDQQILQILNFFDDSVAAGTLVGSGSGNSAPKRLNALRNMLESTGDLIQDMLYEDAREQLEDIYKKIDGFPKPPDFAAGDAASELAAKIQDLLTALAPE